MEDTPNKPSFSPSRRWFTWINTIIGVVAVLAFVAMANYLASGYFKRFQVSANSHLKITPQTTALLQRLTNEIEVTIVFNRRDNEEIYGLTSALLKQYSYINPKIRVQTIDYTRFPGQAASLLSKYNLTALKDNNFIVFECDGRPKVVYGKDLYDYDLNSVLSGESKSFRRESFKGELLFSSAIFTVTNPKQTKAYFVYGHGEHDPEDNSNPLGYGKFAALLKDENNVDWERLSLFTRDIPDDCSLLIIASPSKAQFQDSELAKIDSYLAQGRRLLVLLNNTALGSDSGIEKVLGKWNIGVINPRIEDTRFSPTGGGDLVPAWLDGDHPIFKAIVAEELQIYLVLPRTVGPARSADAQKADAPQVKVLATTSTNAIGYFKRMEADGTVQSYQTKPTAFHLIAAIEHGSLKDVNTARGVTRILVIGDSICFDNEQLDTAANHFFASAAVNWLVDRPQIFLAGIGPRPIKEYKLIVTGPQAKKLQWLLLGGIPGGILLFGGLVWLRRRS